MLTALVQGVMPSTKNVWSCWTNYLTKDPEKTGIIDAALIMKRGSVLSHTPQFKLSAQDIQSLNNLFRKKDKDRVSLLGQAYLVKTLSDNHMIALNEKKHLVVCCSETMFIVVRTECLQERLAGTVTWLEHLCAQLSSRNY